MWGRRWNYIFLFSSLVKSMVGGKAGAAQGVLLLFSDPCHLLGLPLENACGYLDPTGVDFVHLGYWWVRAHSQVYTWDHSWTVTDQGLAGDHVLSTMWTVRPVSPHIIIGHLLLLFFWSFLKWKWELSFKVVWYNYTMCGYAAEQNSRLTDLRIMLRGDIEIIT